MARRVHPIAGVIGFLMIFMFWTSTAATELLASHDAVAVVKQAIPWGFLVLVPALAATGASGFRLAGRSSDPLVAGKKTRMPFIAGNGLLILIPAALYLATLARRGDFGAAFYAVQAIELAAGAINLVLMALSIRDGVRINRTPPAQT